eukprot:CAMPEP_0178382082 /NCGR_PEP_ID=MMETSP0689_2-20121128/6313_1 /TAXON_ID=160604 /ORGANISM="Amphidinium massartii, Strain CS-259" /LENGTH=713 /DNA_ID=CAMNT_0020002281 /DNA_START=1 /DNA_END=2139 /DNA_ORIENTATION=+
MDEEVQPGKQFGPLAFTGDSIEIGELLGGGASGQVFACKRVRTGQDLAVKVVDLRRLALLDNSEDASKKLENEVSALREVKHDRCLGLYDILRTQRWMFIVMERIRGGELFDRIAQKKALNEVEARYVFMQIVDALQYLHSKGIVHRDLKPENILICSEKEATPPEEGTLLDIKIVDFGLSKFKDRGSVLTSMVGTPQYWAPEVLHRSGGYDERVDLWSLGVLLYVMLRGQYPFKGERATENILAGRFDISKGSWQNVSEDAKDLLRQLLRVQPQDRLSLEGCMQHRWVCGSEKRLALLKETPVAEQPHKLVRLEDQVTIRDRASSGTAEITLNLHELLRQQFAFASSLEMACLATRRTHPMLSAEIRKTLHKSSMLSQQSLKVVGRYAQLAETVRDRVLPDLNLAVQEQEPGLAMELLNNVAEWTQQMMEEGKATEALCYELSECLNAIIHEAQQSRTTLGATSPVSTATASPVFARRAVANHSPTPTQELLEGLVAFADRLALAEGDGKDSSPTEECRPELMDLFFMLPGLRTPQPAAARSPPVPVTPVPVTAHGDEVSSSGALIDIKESAGNESQSILPYKPPERNGQYPQQQSLPATATDAFSAGSALSRALYELRRVEEILMDCTQVWINMGGTVKELLRLKDHTESFLKYASTSSRLKDRFSQRLTEYSDFWGMLMLSCRQYCNEMEPGMKKVHRFISEVENAADTV